MITARLRTPALLLSLASAALAGGCRQTPPASSSVAPAVSPDTWAVVNGRSITREDVERVYRRTAPPDQSPSGDEALLARLTLLDDLIVRDILLARAAQLQIELPAAELDTAYLEARKNVPDDQFQQELQRRNLTAADMREALRRDLIAQKLIEREVTSKVTVDDAAVTAFFEANRASFNLAEDAWHLAQIVVTPVAEPQTASHARNDATTPQQAAQKAQMLMARLKEGASFRDLAIEFSEDAESAARGGDLGLVPRSALRQVPAPLRDAVLAVEPGTVRLVNLGGMYTIVLVVSREPAGQRDLSTPGVKERITDMLRGQREQILRTAYLAGLRADAKVVNYLARRVVQANGTLPVEGAPAAAAPATPAK